MRDYSIMQFALSRGIGEATIKRIIQFIDRENISWEEIANNPRLQSEIGLSEEVISKSIAARPQAQKLTDELYSKGIEIVLENDSTYPQHLKKKLGNKCPPLLFIKGNKALLNSNSVGFCGSRKASGKGLSIAEECAKQFAERNTTVVSGYASGIDMAAHTSALMNGGNTIFVLAEGIMRSSIKGDIKNCLSGTNHVFISQFMPNTTWNAGNAMRRNGTIIGLSRAMILVESGKNGGTFAAGEEALRVGCPLFVIDFAQPEVSAEANPYFIEKGGMPIRGKNGIPSLSKVFEMISNNSTNDTALPEQLKFDI